MRGRKSLVPNPWCNSLRFREIDEIDLSAADPTDDRTRSRNFYDLSRQSVPINGSNLRFPLKSPRPSRRSFRHQQKRTTAID